MNTRTGQPAETNDPDLEEYISGMIILYLYELNSRTTRLVYRSSLGWNSNWRNTLMYRVFLEPINFVMARKMLLGIKERVEAAQAVSIAGSTI